MTATLESLGIDRMSFEDRLALVGAIWDSLSAEVEGTPLTEAERSEVDRRLAAHAKSPSAAIPWEQVEAEAIARLAR
jgi:putative addiction module component (TIGR02574 family)